MDLGLSGLITGAAGTVAGLWQNHQNNKMMQKQMDYNTSEREASQRYNTSEREASQQYQTSEREAQNKYNEDMYNKYSSPQAMVEQYKAAGLNPRLAANGDGLGTSVSGGSNGGAPSGAAPSGTHINPPYQNMSAMADSFATMTQGLQALAAAKKAGVETVQIQKFMEENFRGLQLSNDILEITKGIQKVELDVKEQTALKQAIAVWNDTNASYEKKVQELKNLEKIGLLTQKQVDTYDEMFKNQQDNIKADTSLKESQKWLADQQGISEFMKRDLMKASEVAASAQARALSISNEINEDSSEDQKKAYKEQLGVLREQQNYLNQLAAKAEKESDYMLLGIISKMTSDISSAIANLMQARNGAKMASRSPSSPSYNGYFVPIGN